MLWLGYQIAAYFLFGSFVVARSVIQLIEMERPYVLKLWESIAEKFEFLQQKC